MEDSRVSPAAADALPIVVGATHWQQLLSGKGRAALEAAIAAGLPQRRWFGSKTRAVRGARIVDALEISPRARLLLVDVRYDDGPAEVYQLPLALAEREQAAQVLADACWAAWARCGGEGATPVSSCLLYDAVADVEFRAALLAHLDNSANIPGESGTLVAWQTPGFRTVRGVSSAVLPSRLSQAEQSNTSLVYGDRLIVKLLRRLDAGLNPDLELSRHLNARGFSHTPPLAASIEYRAAGHEPWALAIVQQFVPNQGDAWQYFLSRLSGELASATARADGTAESALDAATSTDAAGLVTAAQRAIPAQVTAAFAASQADATRLGQRTAEMHLALADPAGDPSFAPELQTLVDQQAFAVAAQTLVADTFGLLHRQASQLPAGLRALADEVLARQLRAADQLQQFAAQLIEVQRIRVHGDYHLGQVLVAGDDFMIIDFEGEPARPLAERRRKQVALRDVAGMIRSFHYASRTAATAAHFAAGQSAAASAADAARDEINRRAAAWCYWTSVAFLAAYRQTAGSAIFLPRSDDAFARLLAACLLEKAVYELRYELNNRPDWVYLPLTALAELLA
ncbi:MAG: putative maltokinase [Pirellulales bacterium]